MAENVHKPHSGRCITIGDVDGLRTQLAAKKSITIPYIELSTAVPQDLPNASLVDLSFDDGDAVVNVGFTLADGANTQFTIPETGLWALDFVYALNGFTSFTLGFAVFSRNGTNDTFTPNTTLATYAMSWKKYLTAGDLLKVKFFGIYEGGPTTIFKKRLNITRIA